MEEDGVNKHKKDGDKINKKRKNQPNSGVVKEMLGVVEEEKLLKRMLKVGDNRILKLKVGAEIKIQIIRMVNKNRKAKEEVRKEILHLLLKGLDLIQLL